MREILFKGKHIHALDQNAHLNGEWIEGYLSDKNYINSPELEGEFLIDEETICQYIGVHDGTKWENLSENEQYKFLLGWNCEKNRKNTKEDWNGRKIFEGDIIRRETFEGFIVGQVVWVDIGFCGFYLKHEHTYYPIGKGEHTGKSGGDEVLGNIFDNPELIGAIKNE